MAGTRADVPIIRKDGISRPFYSPDGQLVKQGYVSHSPSKEYPNGTWNTIEIYTVGQNSVFVVNGQPNMVVLNATYQLPGDIRKALTKGQIQIQSEGAEIDYRRMKIRSIKEFPQHLQKLIRK